MIDKIVQEFRLILKIVAIDEGEDRTDEYREKWLRTTLSILISKQIEAMEEEKRTTNNLPSKSACVSVLSHDIVWDGNYYTCSKCGIEYRPACEINERLDRAITILSTFK